MKEFSIAITKAKVVTSDSFGNGNTYFPQGLPRRLAGLDRGSKYLLAAVNQAFAGAKPDNEKSTGVAVATLLGSNSSRLKFLKGILKRGKTVADPISFKTTVPSVAAGAVSILYQCCGPTITCIGHGEAGLTALHNACLLIQRGIVEEMIVGGYEDLPEELVDLIPKRLIGKNIWVEGGAALVIKKIVGVENKSKNILAHILGFGLSGKGYRLNQKKKALQKAIKQSLSQTNQSVNCIISAGAQYRSVERALFPDKPIIDASIQWGEALGMSGIIRVIQALTEIKKFKGEYDSHNNSQSILVNGVGISGTTYSVLLAAKGQRAYN